MFDVDLLRIDGAVVRLVIFGLMVAVRQRALRVTTFSRMVPTPQSPSRKHHKSLGPVNWYWTINSVIKRCCVNTCVNHPVESWYVSLGGPGDQD